MGTSLLTAKPDKALLWAPRLLAIAFSLFIAVFALDAFSENTTFVQALPDFLMHLVPTAILLAVVALAWRREWVGAIAFTGLAVVFAIPAHAHPSSIAVISGPLLVVGALYAWTWTHRHAS